MTPHPPRTALVFVIVTLLLDVLGVGILIPTLPRLIADFNGGDMSVGGAQFGLVMATYTLMLFVFAPVQGALSDQYGRRPLLFLSLFGTAVCYAVLWQAPSMAWVFAAQMINGITGASMTVCSAALADLTPPQERSKTFGLLGATFGVGLIIGPALGGALSGFGLHVPFIFAMGLALLDLVFGVVVLPETLGLDNRRPFTWRRGNPMASLRLLARTPHLVGLALILVFTMLGLQCLRSTWVIFTMYRFSWSTAENGLTFALIGLLGAVLQGGVLRILVKRFGEQATLLMSLVLGAASYLVFGFATASWVLLLGVPFSCFSNLAVPVLQGLASSQVDSTEQGQMQGGFTSLTTLCTTVGTLGATALFSYFTSATAPVKVPGAPFLAGATLFIVAIGCTVATVRQRDVAEGVGRRDGNQGEV